MSGGVDSSVSALLLKQQGYEVTGLFMKNWEDQDGSCTASQDYEDVIRVCDTIGIPYYTINFVQEYWDTVFSQFKKELKMGYTPNPDVLCNREIKFKVFLQKAMELGADYLATGHYAQTRDGLLLRSVDQEKIRPIFSIPSKKKCWKKSSSPLDIFKKKRSVKSPQGTALRQQKKKTAPGFASLERENFATSSAGIFRIKKAALRRWRGS